MPAVARKDDSVLSPDGRGKKCRFPMDTVVEQVNDRNVYADKILIVVQGNRVKQHPKSGCGPDTSTLSIGSTTVFIGGKGMGRIGDTYGDNIITQGSSTVFAGG